MFAAIKAEGCRQRSKEDDFLHYELNAYTYCTYIIDWIRAYRLNSPRYASPQKLNVALTRGQGSLLLSSSPGARRRLASQTGSFPRELPPRHSCPAPFPEGRISSSRSLRAGRQVNESARAVPLAAGRRLFRGRRRRRRRSFPAANLPSPFITPSRRQAGLMPYYSPARTEEGGKKEKEEGPPPAPLGGGLARLPSS